jgi:hypothetical protein
LIISIVTEEAFDYIQYHFMIKALRKLGREGIYFNIMKAVYDKPIANIKVNGGKTENILPKLRNKRVPLVPHFYSTQS